MINEEATFEKFDYYSTDWAPKSDKRVVAVCDDCGKVRTTPKHDYRALCGSCCKKGERSYVFGKKGKDTPTWKGGLAKRTCEFCGNEFPAVPADIKRGRDKFCSRACYGKWQSKHNRGKNSRNWNNGASFEPYCHKFNEEFKEYIREKFGRVCFLCSKTEEENGQRLSVHHVNYNKDCGCDDDETCQFAPLCVSCNSKVNKNRKMWEAKIKAMMKNKLNGWYI